MTTAYVLTHLAAPLSAILVALLMLAVAVTSWRTPRWQGGELGGERGRASDIVTSP